MIRFFIITSFVLLHLLVNGQAPVADFSASAVQGCSPLTVTFKDLSTGSPRFWNWELGNGQLSNIQNPTVIYANPGKYTVTLVARNANGTNGVTKTEYITVSRSPTADFTSDLTTACFGATIQFSDRSVANEGSLTKWEWNFGDGTTSQLQSPAKKYTANGFYEVTLKVTSSAGCTKSILKQRYIRIVTGVKAAFTDSVNRVCQPPFNTDFKNETSGPGSLSYIWNFGNGATSTGKNPVASYPAAGNYTIQLIAKSDLGCADTSQRSIRISSANTSISSADSACINIPVTLSNTSTPAPLSSSWTFGDGTTSQQLNPTKSYTAPGVYQVKLVNRYASCSDSITKNIRVIGSPAIDFTSASQGSCRAPFPVNFQDLSPNAISWQWNFGDGGTSTQKNPVYTYTRAGEYDVTLTITTSFGCRNTITKPKFIKITTTTVSLSPAGGCIPYNYAPVANVSSADAISSYLWEFGEGGATSNQANPSYTYRNAGNYTVKLTITTAGGCTATTTLPNAVRTATLPTANFSANEDTFCVAETVQFTNLSKPADEWLWNFGDGKTSNLENPTHAYTDTTGNFTVTLRATNNGCPQTVTKPQFITILPPVAKFSYSTDCNNKLAVNFTNNSIVNPAAGPVSYEWNFGVPGMSNSTLQTPPTIYFPEIKTYTVTLTVTNGKCSRTFPMQVVLTAETADFVSSKASVCKYERFTISATNSNAANIAQYTWSINGGTPFVAPRTFDTSFENSSNYNLQLTITDRNGCTDTKEKSIVQVTGPTASFTVNNTSGCRNTVVEFTDQSFPANNISGWTFDFGDGSSQTYTRGPFRHLYKDSGNYNVRLTVRDRTGCIDSLTIVNAIKITKPVAAFGADQTTFCPGAPLQFNDSSKSFGTSAYLWNFGDGTTSTLKNPTHVYGGRDTSYSVQLTVEDLLGCSDTVLRARYVRIQAPKSAFDIKDTVAICPPLETKFFFKGQNFESFYWDFGDSTTSTLKDSVTHFYNAYGTYTAKLFLVGVGGCLDSSQHTVNVFAPNDIVAITYSPLNACNSLLVDFTVKTPPSTSFLFYFSDGVTDNSQRKTFQHLYNQPNIYNPFLELKDSAGCQITYNGNDAITVIGAEPLFSADKKTFCDSGTVFFTNYTIGNDTVVSSIWNFGDGTTSTETDPTHSFNVPGQYITSLTVNTKNGCTKTNTDTIRVYATPKPTISADDIICINSPVVLEGVLATPDTSVKWTWDLGNGQTSNLVKPAVTYNREGNYTIKAEAVNPLGCRGSSSQNIRIVSLPEITVSGDPDIPVGTGVTLPVTYSSNIRTYTWTPSSGLSCTDCPNPVANPSINTTYTISVTDSNGCVSSKDIVATVVCNGKNYFVPNTFTPNGDGNNDVFFPRGSSIVRVQSMRIFNRWGEVVFEKRNFAANSAADGWNGSYKGKAAQPDAYVYFIEFVCENGSIIPFKGNVTLLK